MKKVFEIIGKLVVATIIGGLLAIIFIEWMAGCGEPYTDSKGVVHQNQCIIVK